MNILYVNACVRQNSRTNMLAQYFLKKFNQNIDELILNNENILPLDKNSLAKRDDFINNQNYDDEMFKYAKQFANADIVVVAAPFWDLSFPSNLKTYFEAVNVTGITFKYSEKGQPQSLCKAKKLVYITTSGGHAYTDEYGFNYVQALCKTFYGIENTSCIKATGLDIVGADTKAILEQVKKEIDEIVL